MRDPRVTEQRNPRTADIDLADPAGIVELVLAEDRGVVEAVASQRDAIAQGIALVEGAFRAGGRLLYAGAGTSGRLGVLDASECPPTFGTDPRMVVGIIAGGDVALRTPVEGAEDDPGGGAAAMDAQGVGALDVVCGIAASGTTPYVRGALERARARGARTILLACSPPPEAMRAHADLCIVPVVGPEVLTGSTRLKAGTATKLVCNLLTTGAMIRIGKTYGNLMVDLMATNAKLQDRAERIVGEVAGVPREAARDLLVRAGGKVKRALVLHALGGTPEAAQAALDQAGGVVRRVLPPPPPVTASVVAGGVPSADG
jgi:N-acetylmuramic acid 6-phosphate etherase